MRQTAITKSKRTHTHANSQLSTNKKREKEEEEAQKKEKKRSVGGMAAVFEKNIQTSEFDRKFHEKQNCRTPKLSFMHSSGGEKMSVSDDSEELLDPLSEELRNVQSVIYVTRENIDALNAKFANLQDPPPMYVAEYQELTSRLHELEAKEHELTEKIHQNESPEPPEEQIEVIFHNEKYFRYIFGGRQETQR